MQQMPLNPRSAPATTPQQRAIQEVRQRYERGVITFDTFQRGLDALLLADGEDECRLILDQLPVQPQVHLDAPASALAPSPAGAVQPGEVRRFFVPLGEYKRVRRAWQLAPVTEGRVTLGEIKLDLTLAALPPHATLRLNAVLGQITVLVPASVEVRVKGRAAIGEINLLGEKSSGFAVRDEGYAGPLNGGKAESVVEIEASVFMGEVKVVQVQGPGILQQLGVALHRALTGEV